jgi:hypothetical protein
MSDTGKRDAEGYTVFRCDVPSCGKESKYEGSVWFSDSHTEKNLCRSHYMKFMGFSKEFRKSFDTVMPCTKEWESLCNKAGKVFEKWFKSQSPVAGKGVKQPQGKVTG